MTISDKTIDDKIAILADYVGRDFMRLARELKELQDIKPDMFIEVVDKLELGKRTAFALARIGRIFGDFDVPDEQLNRIGWAKLNRIGGYLNEENAAHLLSMAESHTYHQLDLILKGQEPVEGTKVMLLYLAEADHIRLSQLMMQHGAKPSPNGGLVGKEAALMAILSGLPSS